MPKKYTLEIHITQNKNSTEAATEYEITTITDLPQFPKNYSIVSRRYRQFDSFNKRLHKIIKKDKNNKKKDRSYDFIDDLKHLPDFPPKKLWGGSSANVVSNRIIMFSNYFKFLADVLVENEDRSWSQELIKFLSENDYD